MTPSKSSAPDSTASSWARAAAAVSAAPNPKSRGLSAKKRRKWRRDSARTSVGIRVPRCFARHHTTGFAPRPRRGQLRVESGLEESLPMKRLLAVAVGFTLAIAAYAHTALTESSPAAGTSVPAPKAIDLTFGGDVRLTAVSLTDAAGAAKHLDAVPAATGSTFSIVVHEPLAPG